MNRIKPFGLVLSGGAVKGIAHIAFLERLAELGIKPNVISGSSAGALIGAFYCNGVPFPEILNWFKETPLFNYRALSAAKPGIFDTDKYGTSIKGLLPATFEELSIRLIVTTTALCEGKVKYFSSGELIKPLLASCSIPLFFSPIVIDGEMYIDGGVMDNFPIDPLKKYPDLDVIGSYVITPNNKNAEDLNTSLKVSNHAYSLLLHAASDYKLSSIKKTINFPFANYSALKQSQIQPIYEHAKEICRKELTLDLFME